MIKVNNKMLKQFLELMDEYDEFLFGTKEYIKKQLELCLNTQGYWSGNMIKVYWNNDTKEFTIRNRW